MAPGVVRLNGDADLHCRAKSRRVQGELDGRFEERRPESGRSGGALEDHAAVGANQVQAVGPAAVGQLHLVVHLVDQRRKPDVERPNAGGSVGIFFCLCPGGFEDDAIPDVGRRLAAISRMGLANVDEQERDLILVARRHVVQGPNLGPERRSGITAEDQRDRLPVAERCERHGGAVADGLQGEVGRQIPGFQVTCAWDLTLGVGDGAAPGRASTLVGANACHRHGAQADDQWYDFAGQLHDR